jgi:hypothetical protein
MAPQDILGAYSCNVEYTRRRPDAMFGLIQCPPISQSRCGSGFSVISHNSQWITEARGISSTSRPVINYHYARPSWTPPLEKEKNLPPC